MKRQRSGSNEDIEIHSEEGKIENENDSLACRALQIVLQHWIMTESDLGWQMDMFEDRINSAREKFIAARFRHTVKMNVGNQVVNFDGDDFTPEFLKSCLHSKNRFHYFDIKYVRCAMSDLEALNELTKYLPQNFVSVS